MLVIRAGCHKMPVRIANSEDSGQIEEGIVGSGYESDIAIVDISINNGACNLLGTV